MVHRTSFLSRHCDVIASFSFGVWSVHTCFLQRDVFRSLLRIHPFILFLLISSEVLIIMSSRVALVATLLLVLMAIQSARDVGTRGVGEDDCMAKKDCSICKAFTPKQVQQLATPTYRKRKSKDKKMVSASPAPTLVDPTDVSVLGKVEGEKAVVQPETTPAGKKKKRSNESPKHSPRSSKKKSSTSSRPSSEDL